MNMICTIGLVLSLFYGIPVFAAPMSSPIPASVSPVGATKSQTSSNEKPKISDEAIVKVIESKMGSIDYCYENELQDKPQLKGKLVVRFVIGLDGRVSAVKTESSSLNDLQTETCVNYHFSKMKFPLPIGSTVLTRSYPLTFGKVEQQAVSVKKKSTRDVIAASIDQSHTKVEGMLSKEQANQTVSSFIGEINKCYEREFSETNAEKGNVVTSVTIDPTGKVVDVNPRPSTLHMAFVRSCISGVYRKMLFPKPEAGSVQATFAVSFDAKP